MPVVQTFSAANWLQSIDYQPPPPPPPPPPPDEPPPPPPELEPGAVDDEEMALLSDEPRSEEKLPMLWMFQPGARIPRGRVVGRLHVEHVRETLGPVLLHPERQRRR